MRLIQVTPCLDQRGEPLRHRLMTTRVREHNETESLEGMICPFRTCTTANATMAPLRLHRMKQTPSGSARAPQNWPDGFASCRAGLLPHDNNMRTAELTGPDLDAWVARAEGRKHIAILPLDVSDDPAESEFACFADGHRFDPSVDPTLGQPIMERERIGSMWDALQDVWCAMVPGREPGHGGLMRGPSMLIAGMRALVVQVYGDQVSM